MPKRGDKAHDVAIDWHRIPQEQPAVLPVLVAVVPPQGRVLLRIERTLLCTNDVSLRASRGWRLIPAEPSGREAHVLAPVRNGYQRNGVQLVLVT